MVPTLRPCLLAKARRSGRRAMVPSSLRISMRLPTGVRPARRNRSTVASVCPARRKTPPGLATRGKTCPGRRKSWAVASGSARSRMVAARSKALIPVVVPRASTLTVKRVPWGSWFLSTMRGGPGPWPSPP